ncbi:MAG: hypothetical protein KJ063_00275 [Anaerolineae bacterium]|nr:hypothetical protein [Anaerolineae bacterium]
MLQAEDNIFKRNTALLDKGRIFLSAPVDWFHSQGIISTLCAFWHQGNDDGNDGRGDNSEFKEGANGRFF